jgi:hypothetical protein
MTDVKSRAVTRRRVPAGPFCTALAIAVGIALTWACVLGWSSQTLNWRSSAYYERVVVTPDGTPIIARTYLETLQRTEYFTLDRKPYAVQELPEITGAMVADAPALTATTPRAEPVILSYSDARARRTAWYFVAFGNPAGTAEFVGYDVLTNERVGYIGLDGFQSNRPTDKQAIPIRRTRTYPISSFIAPVHNQGLEAYWYVNPSTEQGKIPVWICHVVSGDRLLRVDLRERSVRTVLETPGIFSVSVAQRPRRDGAPEGNRPPETEDCLVIRSPGTVTVLDWQDKVERTYRLPSELSDRWFSFFPAANGKAVATDYDHFRLQHRPLSYNVVEFAADGTVSHSASHVTDSPIERDDRVVMSLAAPEAIVPLAVTLLAPVDRDDTSEGTASALAEMIDYLWPLYLSSGILGLLSIALYRRHAARSGNAPSISWMLFVFLFGIPGFLGYFWHRRRPARLACPACGTAVPRDRDDCARCGTLYPAPAPNGLEIFA